MKRYMAALGLIGLAAGPLAAQDAIALPSGLTVSLHDVIMDEAPALSRFRFLAPAIDPAGQGLDYAAVAPDMATLCASYALPALEQTGRVTQEIVITLMDRPVAFGDLSAEATQFFEPFRVENGTCILEEL